MIRTKNEENVADDSWMLFVFVCGEKMNILLLKKFALLDDDVWWCYIDI